MVKARTRSRRAETTESQKSYFNGRLDFTRHAWAILGRDSVYQVASSKADVMVKIEFSSVVS